jgi:hypothetical protein
MSLCVLRTNPSPPLLAGRACEASLPTSLIARADTPCGRSPRLARLARAQGETDVAEAGLAPAPPAVVTAKVSPRARDGAAR